MKAAVITLQLSADQIRAIVGPELRAVLREREAWLTLPEAARHARRSITTLQQWRKMGLKSYDAGTEGERRGVLINRAELDAFIRARQFKPASILAMPERKEAA